MKTKSTKRGFTIVELVIVIAVIAILAAVLIPTLSGVVKKSRMSADETAVRNMNVVLAADGVVTPTSIYDLFAVLAENGIVAKDYSPMMKEHFVFWDSVANKVVYTDENYNVLYPADADARNKDKWVTLSGDISTADVKVSELVDGDTAKVDTAAELFAVAQAMNENKKAVRGVTVIEIADGTYNFMGAELVFADKEGKLKNDLTITAANGATLSGIANIDAASVGENSDGTNIREYNSGLIPTAKGTSASQKVTVKFENITISNSHFGAETTTMAAALVGKTEYADVDFFNVKIDNVTVKGLSKVGTFVGQIGQNAQVTIDANCAATNVKVEATVGMAGKVFGVLVKHSATDDAAITITAGANVVGETVSIKLVKNPGVKYVTIDGVEYAADADAKDGVITTEIGNVEYYRTVTDYGFKGEYSTIAPYEDVDSGSAEVLNKYNATPWTPNP